MALSNRELLIARRKKEKGLPVSTSITEIAPAKDMSRRTSRAFTTTAGKGFQGITEREKEATFKQHPGVVEGIKEPGDILARKFAKKGSFQAGLRPQEKTTALATAGEQEAGTAGFSSTEGRLLTPSVRKQIAGEAGSEISPARRRALGIGGAPQSQSFGLPTDRMPSFSELGGAIGQLFKHVGGIAKKRRALGLIPGRRGTTTDATKGLKGKDLANILLKQLEAANLEGDEDKAAEINARLEAIINPEEASDLAAIENE
jgi:hypothetical protein